jgi:hypothetical protein
MHSGSPKGFPWSDGHRKPQGHDPAHLARRPRPTPSHARLLDLWPRGRPDAIAGERPPATWMVAAGDAADPGLVRLLDRVSAGAGGRRLVAPGPDCEPDQTANPLRRWEPAVPYWASDPCARLVWCWQGKRTAPSVLARADDWYSARLCELVTRRFRVEDWRHTVREKPGRLAGEVRPASPSLGVPGSTSRARCGTGALPHGLGSPPRPCARRREAARDLGQSPEGILVLLDAISMVAAPRRT